MKIQMLSNKGLAGWIDSAFGSDIDGLLLCEQILIKRLKLHGDGMYIELDRNGDPTEYRAVIEGGTGLLKLNLIMATHPKAKGGWK